jgi:hypothetical protein
MMKKYGVLGALALLLLVGAFVLWTMIGGTTDVDPNVVTGTTETVGSTTTAMGPAQVAAHRGPRIAEGSAGAGTQATEDTGEPRELKIEPIKRAYIQREDSDLRGKDAPPPLFTKATLEAVRAAATPAVQKCIKEGLARSPDNTTLDNPISVAIIYTASAAGGSVGVTKAEAVINGTQDDLMLPCIEAAYTSIKIAAPAGQSEGEGRVQAVFDVKK